jgi:hypothetical protein
MKDIGIRPTIFMSGNANRTSQYYDDYVRLVQVVRVGLTSGNLELCRFRDSWLQANSTVIRLPLPIERKT